MSQQSQELSYAVLTVSDSVSAGRAEDTAGPALVELLKRTLKIQDVQLLQVSDDRDRIVRQLQKLVDQDVSLILTTGGTGFGDRDVTPEATREIIQRRTPGLTVAIISAGLNITPLASLSRTVSGIVDRTLIVNLPGSRKAAEEGFLAIAQALPHGLEVLRKQDQESVVRVHRKLGDERRILDRRGEDWERQGRIQSEREEEIRISGRQQQEQRGVWDEREQRRRQDLEQEDRWRQEQRQQQQEQRQQQDWERSEIQGREHIEKSKVRLDQVALRSRESPYRLLSVQEAEEVIRKAVQQLNIKEHTERISLERGLHRVLAEDITAEIDQPPFRASIKDGYAVRSVDGKGRRAVIEGIIAGEAVIEICKLDYELKQGQCLRINTGAVVPRSADAVVQVEDTKLIRATEDGSQELEIEISIAPKKGQDIRDVGSDIKRGSLVLAAGTYLGPAELGLLASVGVRKIKVREVPEVGVLSTGNELVSIKQDLRPGQIYDSNKLLLLSLLKEQHVDGVDLGVARDVPDDTLRKLKRALDKVDILITSGGVSMGDRDILKEVLRQDLNADIKFGRLNVKPGKPTTFATLVWRGRQKLIFALPGNPVSAFVTYQLFVKPALKQIVGHSITKLPTLQVELGEDLSLDPRPEFARAALVIDQQRGLIAYKTGDQISSRLASIPQASALLILPARTESKLQVRKGEKIQVILLRANLIGQK